MKVMTSLPTKLQDILHIIIRDITSLTNGIIFSIVLLLIVFGDTKEGILLGAIGIINIVFSLIQNIRAWNALQQLQLMTASHVTCIGKNKEEKEVLVETIQKGDVIKLKMGDQVPCDGTLTEAANCEINKGLITGESDSVICKQGDSILAGSIITSGSGIITVTTAFSESRIARMTGKIKKYASNASPIQQSVDVISTYSGYVLIATLFFVVIRGIFIHESNVAIVLQAGTMASMLVPQGIAFTVTVFFAYGASNLFKKNVLLQEINATEKLGRIKNLCMDKTGTITENKLSVKEMLSTHIKNDLDAKNLAYTYIQLINDSSQSIEAIKTFLGTSHGVVATKALDTLPFSSWRQYGAITINNGVKNISLFVGPPQIFMPHIHDDAEKIWLANQAAKGERILCFMRSDEVTNLGDLSSATLSIVSVFVFYNLLREGVSDAINFFQERGVALKIISGDSPETVHTVAQASGIHNSDRIITSKEMSLWSPADFEKKAILYSIFAGVVPEQKKQIIEAFKKTGFTAMIGDGANDALAIKTADLGIAMWDGAPAVRQLASVVLTNNSFTALPDGVRLADNIIRYTEMFTSMFLNQTITGFLFFIVVSIYNYSYPLTPFNITLMNYFTIGLPGILVGFWIIKPRKMLSPADTRPFLKKVIPFALVSSVLQVCVLSFLFLFFVKYLQIKEINSLIMVSLIILSFSFFIFSPKVFQGAVDRTQYIEIGMLFVLESILLFIVFQIPLAMSFFNISTKNMSLDNLLIIGYTIPFCYGLQYFITRYFTQQGSARSTTHISV
jgi:cation-transporting ATPase E